MISDSCLFVTVKLLFVLRLFAKAEVYMWSTCLKGQGDGGGGARAKKGEKGDSMGVGGGQGGGGGAQV